MRAARAEKMRARIWFKALLNVLSPLVSMASYDGYLSRLAFPC